MMLIWPTIVVTVSSLAMLGLFGVRWRGQRQMDREPTQNFLRSRALVAHLLAQSSIGADDTVIEIRPGEGGFCCLFMG